MTMNPLLEKVPAMLKESEAHDGESRAIALPKGSDPTDPRAWAKAWADSGKPMDEGSMVGWFNKAIMAGYEAGCVFTLAYPSSEAAASVTTKRKEI